MYAKKRVELLEISEYKKLNPEFFEITLASKSSIPEMFPGQFVEIRVENEANVFLRRPISIHDVDYKSKSLKLLIQVVGPGTKALSELVMGDKVDIMYPLGNSFTEISKGRALLIGGGCGIAPLLFLAKNLKKKGVKLDVLIGARNKEYLLQADAYTKYADVHITTEDGSMGTKGFVIHHPILWDESVKFDKVYTCGPEAMMMAVAKYSRKKEIACEVSLENLMACGFGACLCCVVQTKEGNVCTCTEGPVFNIDELTW